MVSVNQNDSERIVSSETAAVRWIGRVSIEHIRTLEFAKRMVEAFAQEARERLTGNSISNRVG